MVIGLASDHRGWELKEAMKIYLKGEGVGYWDYGLDGGCEGVVDYPEYVIKLGEGLRKGEVDRGVVVCGTGIGVSIVANKMRGVYCALCVNEFMARYARKHNNANVLGLGGELVGRRLAISILEVFLKTEFEGGRHGRRVGRVMELDGGMGRY